MDKRRGRKHNGQKRALVVCNSHLPFLQTMPGGMRNVSKLGQAVDDQAADFKSQEKCRIDERAAADRNGAARVTIYRLVRNVEVVSNRMPAQSGTPAFGTTDQRVKDDAMIARAEAILEAAAEHTDPFVNEGVLPGLPETLASELAAFRKSKEAVTFARKTFTETTAALDQALEDGDDAIAVIESILVASPNAPVGMLAALRQAKLIGPRVDDTGPAEGEPAPAATATGTEAATTTPAASPVPAKAV